VPARAPGQQLAEVERLGEVVVGAGVEAGDAVLDGVAGGQHQDRRQHPGGTEPVAGLEAVDARQHHVEHDRVVGVGVRHPEGVLALYRHVREQAFLTEALANQARKLDFVLHDQHAHWQGQHRIAMSGR
jgi:hypothetical protein